MRRIYITQYVMGLAEEYRDNLFNVRSSGFVRPIDGLYDFEMEFRTHNNNYCSKWKDYADYIEAIRVNLSEILVLKPSAFEHYNATHFNMLTEDDLKSKGWKPNATKPFYERIVEIMRYMDVRSKELIPYIEKLGIRTCVYCNSQYTVTVHVDDKNVKGGYQLDHFFPKSKYPFLCISFFNLQPSCGCCNNWKRERKSLFNLYCESLDRDIINPFLIKISEESLVRYMLQQDEHVLEIIFESPDLALLDNHDELFHISKLYENFKDEAEELVWKKKVNNEVFLQQLQTMFEKKFPNLKSSFYRFLYSFYDMECDIHKRPLTKLKQDVAKQLKLIK